MVSNCAALLCEVPESGKSESILVCVGCAVKNCALQSRNFHPLSYFLLFSFYKPTNQPTRLFHLHKLFQFTQPLDSQLFLTLAPQQTEHRFLQLSSLFVQNKRGNKHIVKLILYNIGRGVNTVHIQLVLHKWLPCTVYCNIVSHCWKNLYCFNYCG